MVGTVAQPAPASPGLHRRAMRAGVLALQGGVSEHASMLEQLGADVVLVRREGDLLGPDGLRLDALILPGGESSTHDRLLRILELRDPLRAAIDAGLPTLGTCAGLILLSREVLDPAPEQQSLGLLDVAVRRNALGPQLASREAEFSIEATGADGSPITGDGAEGRVRGALIRAPQIAEIGSAARAIVSHEGRVLGATSLMADANARGADGDVSTGTGAPPLGRITGISFHPELSGDPALHRALLALAAAG